MRPLIEHARTRHTPETLAEQLRGVPGLMLLRSDGEATDQARYSFVVARPFLTLRNWGSRCEFAPRTRRLVPPFSTAIRGMCLSSCWRGMS